MHVRATLCKYRVLRYLVWFLEENAANSIYSCVLSAHFTDGRPASSQESVASRNLLVACREYSKVTCKIGLFDFVKRHPLNMHAQLSSGPG